MSWARLGGLLGRLGRVLERLGGVLERLGRVLKRLGVENASWKLPGSQAGPGLSSAWPWFSPTSNE